VAAAGQESKKEVNKKNIEQLLLLLQLLQCK